MNDANLKNTLCAMVLIALFPVDAAAQDVKPIDAVKARVIDYWTSERRAGAIPRDLVIDPRGLGYMRQPGGFLEPYGHTVAAQAARQMPMPSPFGKPGGGSGDTTPPAITSMNPGAGATIPASYTFSANVADSSGVASVSFKIREGTSVAQSFSATQSPGSDTWTVSVQGLTDGNWSWQVVAKDKAGKGGNTGSSEIVNFTVRASGGGDTVAGARWNSGGAVQTAAGRIYFEMPKSLRRNTWQGYVCSGTVAKDDTSERSVIITAAHCVYDDVNKKFARNVMFIPDQDGTSGSGTDLNCGNDPLGCWVPSLGVVDRNWTLNTFPNNIAWDYALYVVADSGAHSGTPAPSDALDVAAGSMAVSFGNVIVNDGVAGIDSPDFTYALGYSYSVDPNFMYCAEDMTTQGAVNWWLPSCGLSGGSSGGPWVQPMNTATGNGSIISVNSWGYTSQPGMAGPKLVGTSAECVFNVAKTEAIPTTPPMDGNAGTVAFCQ